VREDPFAFLLALVGDQGMPVERAWSLPALLRDRLGHLDPRRIAGDPRAVRAAVRARPALHRFPRVVGGWIVAAARDVVAEHGGDAGRLWADRPAARALEARLRRFRGIGQKKAALAVLTLARDLGVPVEGMEGSDVACDVHVRRAMLRTGLGARDDVPHLVAAARRLHPARPGALNRPLWEVGRRWCRPTAPDCGSCVLSRVCRRRLARGARVRGVGDRRPVGARRTPRQDRAAGAASATLRARSPDAPPHAAARRRRTLRP
jgi:uncharacterized HhH-GPD family protein